MANFPANATGPEVTAFDEWLERLRIDARTPMVLSVVQTITQQPEQMSYASSTDVAEIAGVNVGSVTRAAQSLGYPGWPALREELRRRYLAMRNATTVSGLYYSASPDGAYETSFEGELRAVSATANRIYRPIVEDAVGAFARAHRRVVVGGGDFGLVAQLLANGATARGYPSYAPIGDARTMSDVAGLEPGDMAVVLGVWRLHETSIAAATTAHSRGADLCIITDHVPSPLVPESGGVHILGMAITGGSFLPHVTTAVAIVNAFCAELATVDPERTRRALKANEEEWNRAGLLRHTRH